MKVFDRAVGSVFRSAARRFGIDIIRLPQLGFVRDIGVITHLYVGCGDELLDGFQGCDLRKTSATDLVCPAWEVSKYCRNLKKIYSRHMLEHLCFSEVHATLRDWNRALAPGGLIEIVVPNIDFHVMQFLSVNWNDELSSEKNKTLAWALAGFHGWQRACGVEYSGSQTKYWDVHKSSFNEPLLRFFLENAGFEEVDTWIESECHLVAVGEKCDQR